MAALGLRANVAQPASEDVMESRLVQKARIERRSVDVALPALLE